MRQSLLPSPARRIYGKQSRFAGQSACPPGVDDHHLQWKWGRRGGGGGGCLRPARDKKESHGLFSARLTAATAQQHVASMWHNYSLGDVQPSAVS